LTTTEIELTEGKHYWEVELLLQSVGDIYIGISRPNLDPAGKYFQRDCTDGWFIDAYNGSLWGNSKYSNDTAGGYKQGDRVGVLLNLDNGSLRFFKNGVEHGPGYAAGSVTGPVMHAVQMYYKDKSVRLLPDAVRRAWVALSSAVSKYPLTLVHPLISILSSSHPLILSSSHPLILLSSHPLILSSSHPLILLSSYPLILSFSHPLILSSSHPLVLSPPPFPPFHPFHPLLHLRLFRSGFEVAVYSKTQATLAGARSNCRRV
jgi:hypothetical protein